LIASIAIGHFATASNLIRNAQFVGNMAVRTTFITGGIALMLSGICLAQGCKSKLIKVMLIVAAAAVGLCVMSTGVAGFIHYFSTSSSLIHYSNIITNYSALTYLGMGGIALIGSPIAAVIYCLRHKKESIIEVIDTGAGQ